MRWRKHVHWFAAPPVAVAGLLFAFVAWWPPLAGRVASPEGRMYFSSSTSALFSTCDANKDGHVDARDVSILKLYWKGFPQPEIDCSRDGFINSRDLSILMGGWSVEIPAMDPRALPTITGPETVGSSFRLALPPMQAKGEGSVGDRFTALLLLSGGDRRVGAGEVALSFDANRLAVRSVRISPSIWTSWTERPHAPYGTKLVFAGGRPGGFSGSLGLIAEVEFEIVAPGSMGLVIRPESVAYAADRAGTPISAPTNIQSETTMVYDGQPPQPAAPMPLPELVQIDALLAPSPVGPVWMMDLSSLSGTNDIPVYEIEDGERRAVQRDDAYILGTAALATHGVKVSVHHADGSVEKVSVDVGSLPGQSSVFGWRAKLGFWSIVELALALGLIALVLRRRPI